MSAFFDLALFGAVFVTLFVIMDPLGSIPLFLGLTGGRTNRTRARLAGQAVLVSLFVISLFAVVGQQILDFLGIGIPALQGAGGLLLLIVALELLTDRQDDPSEVPDVNVALVPLGTPLLAGPGAIVATIVFVQQADGVADRTAIAAGIVAIHVAVYLALRFSVGITRIIRESGIVLLTRIAGLLLSAIAVQLVADSIRGFLSEAFDVTTFGEVFVTLFVIMDPLGSIPLFLGLTGGRTDRTRRRLAGQAVLVSLLVISLFAVLGQQILGFLKIGVPALQGAGGLLLLIVALQLLTDRGEDPTEVKDVNVALVPLGTPLLAGPGAIVATIVFVQQAEGVGDVTAIAAGIVAIHLAVYLALRFSVGITRIIKEAGIVLLTRISGLLLSAIAVQLVADSVLGFARGA